MEEQPETKNYYTPAVKKAIMNYREKNIDKYNEFQRNYYHKKKTDEEWNDRFKERCRIANKKYRDKKRENTEQLPRGRPRKQEIIV
jgi:ABC-type dipeptide/oligopeptide/nickel transport system ATPase component